MPLVDWTTTMTRILTEVERVSRVHCLIAMPCSSGCWSGFSECLIGLGQRLGCVSHRGARGVVMAPPYCFRSAWHRPMHRLHAVCGCENRNTRPARPPLPSGDRLLLPVTRRLRSGFNDVANTCDDRHAARASLAPCMHIDRVRRRLADKVCAKPQTSELNVVFNHRFPEMGGPFLMSLTRTARQGVGTSYAGLVERNRPLRPRRRVQCICVSMRGEALTREVGGGSHGPHEPGTTQHLLVLHPLAAHLHLHLEEHRSVYELLHLPHASV